MKTLSIIITNYNNKINLVKYLNIITGFNNFEYEVILVDDCSTDKSSTVLSEFGASNIKTIINDSKIGVKLSRNIGLEIVKGKYVLFIDTSIDYSSILHSIICLTDIEKDFDVITLLKDINFNRSLETVYDKIYSVNLLNRNSITFRNESKFESELIFNLEVYDSISNNHNIYMYDAVDPLFYPSNKITYSEIMDNVCSTFEFAKSLKFDCQTDDLLEEWFINKYKEYLDPQNLNNFEIITNLKNKLQVSIKKISKNKFRSLGILMKFEMFLIRSGKFNLAIKINAFRDTLRNIKRLKESKLSRKFTVYNLIFLRQKINRNSIVFQSFNGKSYSDNPKYIYEKMYKMNPNLQYYWILDNPDEIEIPGPAKKVKRLSLKYFEVYAKSKVWVSNSRLPLNIKKRSEQYYLQTWHGTPLKKLGADIESVKMAGTNTFNYKRNFKKETDRWNHLISPNPYSSSIFEKAFWTENDRLLEVGYPRNDILVHPKSKNYKVELFQKIAKRNINKTVILYAPTWRDDEFIEKGKYTFQLKLDLEKLYKEFNETHILLLRMHYLIADNLDIEKYKGFVYDVSTYEDINHLYIASDILITDYSSVFFDFSLLNKPILFFGYDIEKYKDELRGFYLDYFNELPGPIYRTNKDLIKAIKNIDIVDAIYKIKRNDFIKEYGIWEDGKASENIANKILLILKESGS
ncbi:bifunctional glycosyltransferase family 2 protein/CDP-glycerol:glycerophosphate glycerophosphotransferase [Macrococcoides canis]|uniref:bifunctional glycosyltransferase family 2 protein/CDP-glycerol:glycerophosphate glycerophosphotransferase n=1 Tax=Macrococcoides canis TaxID=1855823 RepID=UPI0010FBFE47|nr:bifunctional glycosyltransferase family 2 protein/CDP-glycerol:glycerophosphate glycerophosphotransferase [Macrococcus canis]QCT74484.1 CDP-glycerol:glycerophosphate glycerophosphotransferase [Macrococcus canis]